MPAPRPTRLAGTLAVAALLSTGLAPATQATVPAAQQSFIAESAGASDVNPGAAPSLLCKRAIALAESASRIPDLFLSAIGRVESGRALPDTGQLSPWPWTVDAEGQGRFYPTKAAAIEAVQSLQTRGVRSIDVGCLQVNLLQHPEAFTSLEQAFDPTTNAAFAAKLLASLFAQTGSWPLAAAAYHSQTPGIGAPYQQRVLAAWAIPDRPATPHAAPGKLVPGETPSPAGATSSPSATDTAGPAVTGFSQTLPGYKLQTGPQEMLTHGRGLDSYRRFPVLVSMPFRRPQG